MKKIIISTMTFTMVLAVWMATRLITGKEPMVVNWIYFSMDSIVLLILACVYYVEFTDKAIIWKRIFYLSMILLGIAIMIITGYFSFNYDNSIVLLIKKVCPFTDSIPLLFVIGFIGGFAFFRYLYKFLFSYW